MTDEEVKKIPMTLESIQDLLTQILELMKEENSYLKGRDRIWNEKIKIGWVLNHLSMPKSLLGYNFIVESTLYIATHPNATLTKEVYPYVAKQFGTTWNRVERSIRYIIGITLKRNSNKNISKILGYSFQDEYSMTNGEFLYAVLKSTEML